MGTLRQMRTPNLKLSSSKHGKAQLRQGTNTLGEQNIACFCDWSYRLYRFCHCSELLKAGHQVLGLARSDAGAKSLAAAGAEVHHW